MCCEPPTPVNLICVVGTTLSPDVVSPVKGMDTSLPVTYLLYWDVTVTVVGIHLRQYPLFPVSVPGGDVGPDTPSFTLPPVVRLFPLVFPSF